MTRPRLSLVRHGETDWNAEGRLLSLGARALLLALNAGDPSFEARRIPDHAGWAP